MTIGIALIISAYWVQFLLVIMGLYLDEYKKKEDFFLDLIPFLPIIMKIKNIGK